MARIHKINGYLIDTNGDYSADNIETAITERSGLDVFSQHLCIETAECGEWADEHPLNKLDCDVAECEKYFPKQGYVKAIDDFIDMLEYIFGTDDEVIVGMCELRKIAEELKGVEQE